MGSMAWNQHLYHPPLPGTPAPPPPRPSYEYNIIRFDEPGGADMFRTLNEYGGAGWRVAWVHQTDKSATVLLEREK